MEPLRIFVAQFLLVFLLGFQSQCVRDGSYVWAAVNSFFIAWCSLIIAPVLANPDLIRSDSSTLFAFIAAGCTGITASIWIHQRTLFKGPGARD